MTAIAEDRYVEPINERSYQAVRSRMARPLDVNPAAPYLDAVFGGDLKASLGSDWKANEFDHLDYDIRDVAYSQVRKELRSGILVIGTVSDYCQYMVHCYRTKPKEVVHILLDGKRA